MGSLGQGQMGYIVVFMRDPCQAQSVMVMVLQIDFPWVTEISTHLLLDRSPSEQLVLFASVNHMYGDEF